MIGTISLPVHLVTTRGLGLDLGRSELWRDPCGVKEERQKLISFETDIELPK